MPLFSAAQLEEMNRRPEEAPPVVRVPAWIAGAFPEIKPATKATPAAVAESAAKPAVAEPKKKKIIRIDLTPHKRDRE